MGKPAVMAGFWGSHMGLVDLMLERDGNTWRIASHDVRGAADLRARNEDRSITALVESDEAVLASVEDEHEATLAYVRTPRSGKRMRRCIPTSRWWRTIRRSRSCRTRRPGTSRR
jgi:2',3'-cyclic-nucleotide 2'-phosphodiesterase (5'-nucleotidase family)